MCRHRGRACGVGRRLQATPSGDIPRLHYRGGESLFGPGSRQAEDWCSLSLSLQSTHLMLVKKLPEIQILNSPGRSGPVISCLWTTIHESHSQSAPRVAPLVVYAYNCRVLRTKRQCQLACCVWRPQTRHPVVVSFLSSPWFHVCMQQVLL